MIQKKWGFFVGHRERIRERRRDTAKDTKEQEKARWAMAYRKAKRIKERELKKLKQAGVSDKDAKEHVGKISKIY